MALGKRIETARTYRGMTQEQLGSAIGAGQATIQALEKRDSKRTQYASSIAEVLRVRLTWLLTGEGEMEDVAASAHPNIAKENGMTGGNATPHIVPVEEVALVDGAPTFIKADKGELYFTKEYIAHRKLPFPTCKAVEVSGASMAPTFKHQDIVLIDTRETKLSDGDVFAVYWGHELRIRRAHHLPGNLLKISCDNPDKNLFPDVLLDATLQQQMHVLGRVIWRGG